MIANSGNFKFQMVCAAQNLLRFWQEACAERHLVSDSDALREYCVLYLWSVFTSALGYILRIVAK